MALFTLDGHVSRAVDLFNKTSLWIALGRSHAWTVARLVGYLEGPFTTGVGLDHDFVFEINGFEVTYSIPDDWSGKTVAAVVTEINVAAALVDASLSAVAANSNDRIQLTAPAPDDGEPIITIIAGSDTLGFLTDETDSGTEDGVTPGTPSATQVRMNSPFALKKVTTKYLVIPDEDTAASITSTNGGNTFNTSIATGDNVFEFKVNGSAAITVTFPDSAATPAATVRTYINNAANGVSPDFASVATLTSDSPPKIKLTSPTEGVASSIEVTNASSAAALDIAVQTVTGTAGGAYKFRTNQFASVDVADAYDEDARIVYFEATMLYDELPLGDYSQVGLLEGVAPIAGLESREYLEFDEVDDWGHMHILDNRKFASRETDTAEKIRIALEL